MANDAATISDPQKFDGFRYYRARQKGGLDANRNQFVSLSKQSMSFGYGKHACPGRFFAGGMIKIILGKLLLEYDLEIVGEKGVRYPNMKFETMVSGHLNFSSLSEHRLERGCANECCRI